jgi:hypothetical protein
LINSRKGIKRKQTLIPSRIEIPGGVNNKGSSTDNKTTTQSNATTLNQKDESVTITKNQSYTKNISDVIKQVPPTTDAFIPNTLKKKRRNTNKKEKVGQLYESIINRLSTIRNAQYTNKEEEINKEKEEEDKNNTRTKTEGNSPTNQGIRQVRVYEEDEESVESIERTPTVRIRGGATDEAEEDEEEEDERLALDDLDEEDALPIGGQMGEPKIPGMIRISGCNPNGIKANQLQCHLQHSQDLQIDIQCYSEVNRNFLRTDVRQKFHEGTKRMDRSSRGTWGTSQLPTSSDSDLNLVEQQ